MEYIKNEWKTGDVITADKMNHMEDGIADAGKMLVETTYAELLQARNNGTLIPGMQYRITDYICTTTQKDSRVVSNPFDIIVVADDESTLNENARACLHDGDTYYSAANHSAVLEAWELKYCIDNDTNRFGWADETNGKGVIYWLKDERDNECPYDFKQIQFSRTNSNTTNWYYTFSVRDESAETIVSEDASISLQDGTGCINYGNIINNSVIYGKTILQLNNIIFDNIIGSKCYSNTFGYSCSNNIFDNNCYSNTFGYSCSNNIFGNNCYSNTFDHACYSNTFGNKCIDNTLDSRCNSNIFGDKCHDNTLGDSCNGNTFESDCHNNTFGNNCNSNKLKTNCESNVFGDNCMSNDLNSGCTSNIFRNYCSSNTLTGGSGKNTFGNDCGSNTLTGNGNVFGDRCNSNTLTGNYNTFGDRCNNNSTGNYNTFGNSCNNNSVGNSNTFGNSCNSNSNGDGNTFGNSCDGNTFGNSCDGNTFGNKCNNITFSDNCHGNVFGNNCTMDTFSKGCFFNIVGNSCNYINLSQGNNLYNILDYTSGKDNSKLNITGTSDNTYVTYVGKNSSGELKMWVPADLVQ